MIIISSQNLVNHSERDTINRPQHRRVVIEHNLAKYVKKYALEPMTPAQLLSTYPSIYLITGYNFINFLYSSYTSFAMCQDIDLTSVDGNGLIPLSINRKDTTYLFLNNIPLHLHCGFYATDLMTPIYENTYQLVSESIQITYLAAQSAFSNGIAYALVDSPGHHASYNQYGGYCFVNNSVFGALSIQKMIYDSKKTYYEDSVLIFDIDYHHSDGTQELCKTCEINTISIHMNPIYDYPKHSGYEFENSKYTTNIIVEPKTDISGYIDKLNIALNIIATHKPDAIVLSIGYDILIGDPDVNSNAGMNIKPEDFKLIANTISSSLFKINKDIKVLIVQEGGYNLDLIPEAAYNFVENFKLQ